MSAAGFLARFLLLAIATAQGVFVLEELAELHLPVLPTALAVTLLVPAPLALRAPLVRELVPATPPTALRGLALGAALFALWGAGYFGIGAFVDPSRVTTLPTTLEDHLPFWPSASALYVCVDPLFFLPFALLPDEAALSRHVRAVLAVLAVSFVCWLAFPVEMPRPPVPEDAAGFGAWLLRTIQGNDPSVNCLPSTHCAMAALAALSTWRFHRRLGAYLLVTAALIGLSTVLTRQHYLLDVGTGFALGALAYAFAFRGGGRIVTP